MIGGSQIWFLKNKRLELGKIWWPSCWTTICVLLWHYSCWWQMLKAVHVRPNFEMLIYFPNILILPPTSYNCHYHKVTTITFSEQRSSLNLLIERCLYRELARIIIFFSEITKWLFVVGLRWPKIWQVVLSWSHSESFTIIERLSRKTY